MNYAYVELIFTRLIALRQRLAAMTSMRDFDSDASRDIHRACMNEVRDMVTMQEETCRKYVELHGGQS